MPDPYTRVNLVEVEVEVAAPDVARALEAGPDGLEFPVVGPHHQGDGEPVEDPWVA